ncbi:hypothetical protein A3Q56_00269 [Intoshia linei]|uniref:Transcription factor TFIIB cyclin-like domain-containing protein n=1 Tax=Intoshia linei TaxID=1819745 RepID=A0A177BCA5_9BILA|nr:hypothetical protein A3Q56_00269 [Intoshia linei]
MTIYKNWRQISSKILPSMESKQSKSVEKIEYKNKGSVIKIMTNLDQEMDKLIKMLPDRICISDKTIMETKKMMTNLISENYSTLQHVSLSKKIISCLFISSRKNNYAISYQEISKAYSFSIKSIRIQILKITQLLNIRMVSPTINQYIHRYCALLNLNKKIYTQCIEISRTISDVVELQGRHTSSIAAACIYLIIKRYINYPKLDEISKISDVSKPTIKNIKNIIETHNQQSIEVEVEVTITLNHSFEDEEMDMEKCKDEAKRLILEIFGDD